MATRLTLIAVVSLCAGMAQAATVTVQDLSKNPSAYATYLASIPASKQVVEDFEGIGASVGGSHGAEVNNLGTSVGTFSTIGGRGNGYSVKESDFDNTGNNLALRNGTVNGRSNTTSGGNWVLDSNDTLGLTLALNSISSFSRIGFVLSDIADNGRKFELLVNDEVKYSTRKQANGGRFFFEIDFGEMMSKTDEIVLTFRHNKTRDGFSIDDIAIATAPIPASALMLLAAVGGLGALRRKKAAAAA